MKKYKLVKEKRALTIVAMSALLSNLWLLQPFKTEEKFEMYKKEHIQELKTPKDLYKAKAYLLQQKKKNLQNGVNNLPKTNNITTFVNHGTSISR